MSYSVSAFVRRFCISTIALSLVASALQAGAISLNPVADTYITVHPGLGGPTSAHGSDAGLYMIGTPGFLSNPLFRFDLSALAGQTVSGPGTVTFTDLSSTTVTNDISVHQVLIAWSESALTWNTFGAVAGPDSGTDFASANLDSKVFTLSQNQTVQFTIAASVLQSWINTPASNFGIILINNGFTGGGNDLALGSRESANPAVLAFSTTSGGATPEPATWIMMALGLAAIPMLRRR